MSLGKNILKITTGENAKICLQMPQWSHTIWKVTSLKTSFIHNPMFSSLEQESQVQP